MRMLFAAAAAMSGLLASCVWPPAEVPGAGTLAPSDFPEAYYWQAAARGAPVFRVDPAASLVVILVRRAGSLARLGHDHVVASHDVQGFVAPGAGRADFYLPLDRLVVDEPRLRAEANFDTVTTAEDIAATRRNMLNSLDAARYPFALVSVAVDSVARGEVVVPVAVTLHGITRRLEVPVHVDIGTDEVTLTGRLALKQTDFGIAPMSVLGGAIQVQDQVDLRIRVRAAREGSG